MSEPKDVKIGETVGNQNIEPVKLTIDYKSGKTGEVINKPVESLQTPATDAPGKMR